MPKRLKDPNKPKKPLTAYFRFLSDIRESVKTENPGIKPAQLTKICGKKWSVLEDGIKKPYIDSALIDNTAWKLLMEEYKKTPEHAEYLAKNKVHVMEQKRKARKKKRKLPKDPNCPKKPVTAFFLYSAHVRAEVKESMPEEHRRKVTLITKKIGAMWGLIAEEEKAMWKARTNKLREEYQVKLAAYKLTAEFQRHQANVLQAEQIIKEDDQKEREKAMKLRQAAKQKNKKRVAKIRKIEPDSETSSEESEESAAE